MMEDLDYWRDAPVWTVPEIEAATADWFRFLDPQSAEKGSAV
jgi:UDP-glucose 4-epimerase